MKVATFKYSINLQLNFGRVAIKMYKVSTRKRIIMRLSCIYFILFWIYSQCTAATTSSQGWVCEAVSFAFRAVSPGITFSQKLIQPGTFVFLRISLYAVNSNTITRVGKVAHCKNLLFLLRKKLAFVETLTLAKYCNNNRRLRDILFRPLFKYVVGCGGATCIFI